MEDPRSEVIDLFADSILVQLLDLDTTVGTIDEGRYIRQSLGCLPKNT